MRRLQRKKKLVYKFWRFVLPLVSVSIIFTGITLSATNYIYFRKNVKENYRNIIKSSAGEIRLFIDMARTSLQSLGKIISNTKLNPWQKEIALTAFSHNNPHFLDLAIIDPNGNALIRIDGQEDGLKGKKELLNHVVKGENKVSGIVRSKNGIPYIEMAIPLLYLGEVREILWAELNLKFVWDILEGIQIGQTGEIFIMDVSGRYIAHRKFDHVVRTASAEKRKGFEALRSSGDAFEWTETEDTQKYYCLGEYIPHLDWIVVLSQTQDEIYGYLYWNIVLAVLITGVIGMIAILLVWNWIKKLVYPIQRLHQEVIQIGSGNLDRKIVIDSEDEIGGLGRAFNEMVDSLKAYIQRNIENATALVHAKNLAVLGTTTSKVTHEVGNLVNNLKMALIILKCETLSEKGNMCVELLGRCANNADQFIRDFLQFAKKPNLNLQRVNMEQLIQDVIAVYREIAMQKGIAIEFSWDTGVSTINADSRLISQAIDNLVKNGVEAISDSGKIDIRGSCEGHTAYISIRDTGCGVSDDIRRRLFEPFFTTKGKGGTGLGLSIVKGIIEAHQGTIACESLLGKGALFTIQLPIFEI